MKARGQRNEGAIVSSGEDEVVRKASSRPGAPCETSPVPPRPLRGADDEFATEWVYYDEEEAERSQSSGGKKRS